MRDKAHKGVLTAGKQNCLVTHLKKRNNNNSSNNTKTEIDRNDLQGSFPSKQLSCFLFFARSRRSSYDSPTLAGRRSLMVLQHVTVASSLSDCPSTN